ncbi:MAG: LON peptidase substrate-binding domain-containing protein [Bacteroidota bacterium]
MYLPLFPLKLVAFPGEELNLHIFEPRYRQLIADVEAGQGRFGVCAYLDKLSGFGTEMELVKIHKRYDDGRLDIMTLGKRVFKLKSFDNPLPGKLYAGGEVEFFRDSDRITPSLKYEYIFYLKEILYLLSYPHEIAVETVNSYTYAHKVGLSLEEELELIQLPSEGERVAFLTQHFKRIIPMLKAAEQAKEKIKQNGHFKHLDPLNF